MEVTKTQIEIMIKHQEAILKSFRRREADYEGILTQMEPGPERMRMRTEADASARKCREIQYALDVLNSLIKLAR